jgi:Spy/CpxP family protein refolding chaperone
MKTVRSAIIAAVVLFAGVASAAQAPAPAATPWEEQARSMLYLIMNLSSINVVNGISLTRDQALKLRELAKKVESVSPPAPDLRGSFRPDLGEVRDTYVELRGILLSGKEVSGEMEKRVGQARSIESAILRLAAGSAQPSATGCLRCHGAPEATDVRGAFNTKAAMEQPLPPRAAGRESFVAHETGLIGQEGLAMLVMLTPQVDAILTPEQRAAFESFACCLIPPKSMTDPVRIGQAASGEKEINILRWVRSVSEDRWPATKAGSLEMWKAGLVIKSPGLAEADKNKAVDRIAKIYEQTRALSDVDFELDKTRLADQLHEISTPTQTKSDGLRKFSATMFLIGNGTVEAYGRLLERLDTATKQAAK